MQYQDITRQQLLPGRCASESRSLRFCLRLIFVRVPLGACVLGARCLAASQRALSAAWTGSSPLYGAVGAGRGSRPGLCRLGGHWLILGRGLALGSGFGAGSSHGWPTATQTRRGDGRVTHTHRSASCNYDWALINESNNNNNNQT